MSVSDRLSAVIAANRFGLGARPGELEHIGSDARGWLTAQLGTPTRQAGDGTLASSRAVLSQALLLRKEIQETRQAAGAAAAAPAPSAAPALPAATQAAGKAAARAAHTAAAHAADVNAAPEKLAELLQPVYLAEVGARFDLAIRTDQPFLERLTQFWTNHFSVSAEKALLPGLAGAMEREAIRPHVLGTFRELLLAAESHPAMLLYLDNQGSTGPHSPAGFLSEAGLNENLAREILELHTLGVDGGYTQQDVTAFAAVLSGWSIGRPDARAREPAGAFLFRARQHEPGARTLLGKTYAEDGFAQGVAVLADLASHPSTARLIATKLARHFIADEPPPAAVERLTHAFLIGGGYLPNVYKALIESPEAWAAGLAKVKSPSDYLISTHRGLALPAMPGKNAAGAFEQLGQRMFAPSSPAGWPDRSADWDGASALLKRIEWAGSVAQHLGKRCDARALAPQLLGANLTPGTVAALARASNPAQATTLLLASPEFLRR